MKTTVYAGTESASAGLRPEQALACRRALTPHAAALRAWFTVASRAIGPEASLTLSLAGEPFEIGVWERSQLELFSHEDAGAVAREHLTGYALALVTKCAIDVEHFAQAEHAPGGRYDQQAHLMVDVDLGRSLVTHLDAWIEDSVGAGQTRRASRLSLLRHRLARALTDVRRTIAEAEGVAHGSTPELVHDTIEVVDTEPPFAPARRAAAAAPTAARPEPPRQRTPPLPESQPVARTQGRLFLAGLLVAMALAWLVVSWMPSNRLGEIPTLTLAEVAQQGPYLAVASRHPSLFVTVDAAGWSGMNAAQRVERVELVASMLRRREFAGALFSLEDGRPVARWLASRGTELLPLDP